MSEGHVDLVGLSPEAKRELLTRLLRERASARACDYRLSYGQEALWILHQLAPESSAYNLAFVARVRGDISESALRAALGTVMERHAALRTTFETRAGVAVQRVGDSVEIVFEVIDARGWSQQEVEHRAEEVYRRPFDLSKGPLVRAALFSRSSIDHVVILALHHIVCDGASFAIVLDDWMAAYARQTGFQSGPLPPPGALYTDFVAWQREMLEGSEGARLWSYWSSQLAGDLPVLELPTDRPRPVVPRYRGASQTFKIDQVLNDKIRALAKTERATPYMVLLAAYQILLCRHSGHEELIVGSPTLGRARAEFETVVGNFINPVALRADVSGDPMFRSYLARVRQTVLGALAHSDYPFSLLVRRLPGPRETSHSPIFQVLFNLLKTAPIGRTATALPSSSVVPSLEPLFFSQQEGQFELSLEMVDTGDALEGSFRYDSDLFEAKTIRSMAHQFKTLLQAIAAYPDQTVSELALLTEEERRNASRPHLARPPRYFDEFSKKEIEQSIPTRFERWVNRAPTQIAVKTPDHEWTYEQLHRRSSAVAQRVLECQNAGGRVGLIFDHDALMVSAVMGVLMAGKAYVPLDPLYPRERLAYMLKDSAARVLLTSHGHLELARELAGDSIELIVIDEMSEGATAGRIAGVAPETLAYILYTSGSTGHPKGVMQSQRNVLHHIRVYTNNLRIHSGDRLTLLSSYSFDAAVMDIFGALLNGATLCPLDVRQVGLAGVRQCLLTQGITIYHSTPTLFRTLCGGHEAGQRFSGVRSVVLGGEEAHRGDLDLYRLHFDLDCTFVNGLGPTESTLALQMFINHDTDLSGPVVPVGYPVDGTEVLLLTPEGAHATVCGEIAIKSEHLALGYWGRPELTAGVFQPDPTGGDRRIYHTGDMGRLRPDGAIEFLGRRDDQVKIRGYRIELGEIEAALSQYEGVALGVVVAKADRVDGKRLVAYVAPKPGRELSTDHIRDFLRQRLPEYMLPTAFMVLESLPLTATGKVDRRALPQPVSVNRCPGGNFVASRTPVEDSLVAIWSDVLKIERVGVEDNFFDLGGHSLLVMQVVSRVESALGIAIPVRSFFELQTVAALAVDIERRRLQGHVVIPRPEIKVAARGAHRVRAAALDRLAGEEHTG